MLIQYNFSNLIGQELCSILIATNSIRMQFIRYPLSTTGSSEDSTIIEIEYGYAVTSPPEPPILLRDSIENFRLGADAIIRHIECAVKSAELYSNGDLHLVFDDEFGLRIIMGDDGFEGYQVHTKSADIAQK